jgi:uncharacterized membrane protein
MTRARAYWGIAIGLTVATCLVSAVLYPNLPAKIPTHWNIRGEVDGYGSRVVGVMLLPAITLGLLLLFRLLPWLSPKDFEVDKFRETYLFIMLSIVGLLCYMHFIILYMTWRHLEGTDKGLDLGRLLFGGLFLFLALIGNVMGKVRRNFYVGVRVPWTLASDRVWNDTHRFAAWTMVSGNLIGFFLLILGLPIVVAVGVMMVSMLSPIVYSFVHYKALERRGAL